MGKQQFGWAAATAFLTAFAAGAASATCAPPDANSTDAWLPQTPMPAFDEPPPHPASDCPFYQAAWQAFLYETQAGADGLPRFLDYPAITDPGRSPPTASDTSPLRTSFAATLKPSPSAGPTLNAGFRQAASEGVLVDQRGYPVFYSIHVNRKFSAFVNRLRPISAASIAGAGDDLVFPTGAIEMKAAWQIVSGAPTFATNTYLTTDATVPILTSENGRLVEDLTRPPRRVTVALLALHVVFRLEGHPEFVWSTFEHIDAAGMRDNAPAADSLRVPGHRPISSQDFPLYSAGTKASEANIGPSDEALADHLDEQYQRFRGGFQTPVFRVFPASKLDGVDEDGDIVELNESVGRMFEDSAVHLTDRRRHYQLVGAVWLDNPRRDFTIDSSFANQPGETTDTPEAMIAGEDGLSSTAMESFTQDGFPNCLSCHDTRAIHDPATDALLPPSMLNVSRLLPRLIDTGMQGAANLPFPTEIR